MHKKPILLLLVLVVVDRSRECRKERERLLESEVELCVCMNAFGLRKRNCCRWNGNAALEPEALRSCIRSTSPSVSCLSFAY